VVSCDDESVQRDASIEQWHAKRRSWLKASRAANLLLKAENVDNVMFLGKGYPKTIANNRNQKELAGCVCC